jgi:hypothetical protein
MTGTEGFDDKTVRVGNERAAERKGIIRRECTYRAKIPRSQRKLSL